jgi:alpha-L-fucosidase
MKIKNLFISACLTILLVFQAAPFIYCQNTSSGNYIIINPDDKPADIIKKAANVVPSKRQYDWQRMEMTAFIHFGINTYNEVEWGSKGVDISKFNPTELNTKQWVKVLKEAGMKLIILTCKHHDGFCLWPSKYTNLNIAHTPFQNGKGDIVRDLSNACREAGIKFGVYLSPWDMNEPSYGTPEYNQHFLNQLTELLTNYGKISEVWFDGANGEGPNGKKQVYDWQAYYKLIRKLQPDAVIAVSGPDIRWVGTESGYGRKTEWSVLPGSAANEEAIAANSQQAAADGAFIPHDLMDEDLGSREKILKAGHLTWYPSEVDVSIRKRWFYNPNDDEFVKTPEKLVDIYFNSVGLNSLLLLNVPPDKRGLITDNDIKSLKGMRYILDETFKKNFVSGAKATASGEAKGTKAKNIIDNKHESYWAANEKDTSAVVTVTLKKEETFNCAMLQENILKGQRVEKYRLEFWNGTGWETFVSGTTIGYKRLFRFPEVSSGKVRIVIEQSRLNPTIASFGLYKMPPSVSFEPEGASFSGKTNVKITGDSKTAVYYYTTDGSTPTKSSLKYNNQPINVAKSLTITAIAVSADGKASLPASTAFNKALYNIKLNTEYSDKFPGQGIYTLVDGVIGSSDFGDGKWQGYYENDLDVVIDLGTVKPIDNIAAGFMSDQGAWILLPKSVDISVSDDGNTFKTICSQALNVDEKNKKDFIHKFEAGNLKATGRYVHFKANNIKTCPEWHKGAGDKAWLFADEITIK